MLPWKRLDIFIVLLVAFVDWMGIGLVYPMFSSMVFDNRLNLISPEATDGTRGLYLGILLAALSFAQFFSSPILGTLSDGKGRKKTLIYSLWIGVFGYVIAMIAVMIPNVYLLILSRIIIGISAGSAAIVSAAIADLSRTQKERTKNFALYSAACGTGFAAGPFLGGKFTLRAVQPNYGFAVPFLIAGIMLVANIVLIIFFYRETHVVIKGKKISWVVGLHNLKKAFHHVDYRSLFVTIFLFAFGWSFYSEFIPVTWIRRYQLDVRGVGSLYAYASAIYAISAAILIRPIVNRFKAERILFNVLWIQGLYILLFLIPMTLFWVWPYLTIQQYLGALSFPILQSLISNRTPENQQGEMLGILQSVLAAGFILSPLISGPMLGISTNMPMYVGGIAFLCAALVMGVFLKKEIFYKK